MSSNPWSSGLTTACGVFGVVAAEKRRRLKNQIFGDSNNEMSHTDFRSTSDLDISRVICLGLVALQHRGQESAGIVTSEMLEVRDDPRMTPQDNGKIANETEWKKTRKTTIFHAHRGVGLVNQIFTDRTLDSLRGGVGIGHNRYSTSGGTDPSNCQPFVVETVSGRIAVAHNGELVNAARLRRRVLERGVGLSTFTDSEVIVQILARPTEEDVPSAETTAVSNNRLDWASRIRRLMSLTPLSYSLLVMHEDRIYAARDPFGNRPLCLGTLVGAADGSVSKKPRRSSSSSSSSSSGEDRRLQPGVFGNGDEALDDRVDGWVVSSESCAFTSIGAEFYREVLPGEIVEISPEGVRSLGIVDRPDAKMPPALCIFEYVYFARADSVIEGQTVYNVRQRCGSRLALECPVEADIVSTVPESATPAAMGFADASGIPYVEVLIKNRYIGRTFIQPSTRQRKLGVTKKFGPLTENFKDKRIVLVDDSIVRGNTIKPIIQLLRRHGAREVHVRVASPPVRHPCFMGINIPTKDELLINQIPKDRLPKHLDADSVSYLSVEGLVAAVEDVKDIGSAGSAGSAEVSDQTAGKECSQPSRNEIKGRKPGEKIVSHCTACLTGEYPIQPFDLDQW